MQPVEEARRPSPRLSARRIVLDKPHRRTFIGHLIGPQLKFFVSPDGSVKKVSR